jgi:hypothetical protein
MGCDVSESIVCVSDAVEDPGRTVLITDTQAVSANGAMAMATSRIGRYLNKANNCGYSLL